MNICEIYERHGKEVITLAKAVLHTHNEKAF